MRGFEVAAEVAEFRILSAPVAEPPLESAVAAPLESAVAAPPLASVRLAPSTTARGPSAEPIARVLPRRPSGAEGGRPGTAAGPDPQRFVLSTLRPMFEVLDRRRPARHLTAIATGTVVDVLRALAEQVPRSTTVSGWGRVHVCPVPAAAEIHLTYQRGERVLAAAGRVEFGNGRWRWVAFTTAA